MKFGLYLSRLAALVLPPACPLCRRTLPLAWEEPFCVACLSGFPPLPEVSCPRCALPFPSQVGAPHLCGRCSRKTPPFSAVYAVGLYEENLRRVVQQFKFNRHIGLDRPLGQLLVRQLPPGHAFDLIIPVPLHPRRLRERSYNQSLLLAREVGRLLKLPVAANLLQRTLDTESQRQFSAIARERNIRRAFSLPRQLNGEKILLIDDVMTTGATVSACSRELLRGGGEEVQVAVIGRAPIH